MLSVLMGAAACTSSSMMEDDASNMMPSIEPKPVTEASPPSPDPRVGLKAGLFDAQEATWNLNMLSQTPPIDDFIGVTNSDLAFRDNYVFQGNYNGVMICAPPHKVMYPYSET